MTGLALALLAQAFIYSVEVDPFTDARTYVASNGSRERGPSLSVECGDLTGGKIAVRITPGFHLYTSGVPGTYTDRYRFDDREPAAFRVAYRGEEAFLTGRQATKFVDDMLVSSTVTFEMTDRYSETVILRMGTSGAADSVRQVREHCASD